MDYGHKLTEKELAKLEKQIAKEYDEARKSVKKKAASALKKYEEKYEKQKALYKQGIITYEELKEWKKKQLAQYNYFSDLQKILAQDCANANAIALGIINQSNIDIYALNMNYGTYEIESGLNINTSFSLYDHNTVEQLLLTKDSGFMPVAKQNIPKDIRWNRKHVASQITQGILAGDSIPQIAKRLQTVTDMNRKAAIRNARTYTTAAENAGRIDSYERAQKLGINLKQQWIATPDARVRDSHALLDGEIVEVGQKFSNGLRYPADPTGAPEEVYNCRCTLVAAIDGLDNDVNDLSARFSRLDAGMTYEEWKELHGAEKEIAKNKVIKIKEGVFDKKTTENINRDFALMDREEAEKWKKVIESSEYDISMENSGAYNKNKNVIELYPESEGWTVIHENAHFYDYNTKLDYQETLVDRKGKEDIIHFGMSSPHDVLMYKDDWEKGTQDYSTMLKVIGLSTDENGNLDTSKVFDEYKNWAKKIKKKHGYNDYDSESAFGALSDIISSMTQDGCGESLLHGGHSKSYWSNMELVYTENWADFCYLKATKRTEMLDLLKEIAPNKYNDLEEVHNLFWITQK